MNGLSSPYPYLLLGAFLFSVGMAVVIARRSAILMLLGIELMLNASNLNLIAFSRSGGTVPEGHFFALFVMVVAVCESAVGLALVLAVYRYFKSSVPDEMTTLKD